MGAVNLECAMMLLLMTLKGRMMSGDEIAAHVRDVCLIRRLRLLD